MPGLCTLTDATGALRGVRIVSRVSVPAVSTPGMSGSGVVRRLALGLSGGDEEGNRRGGVSLRGGGIGVSLGVKLKEAARDLPC